MAKDNLNERIKKENYFEFRGISPESYHNYIFPRYLEKVIPKNRSAKILDIGCGFGQLLLKLKERGYTNIKGIDLSKEACAYCRSKGLKVESITDIPNFEKKSKEKYDFIIMSHVLEHIEKEKIIKNVVSIRNLLKNGGKYCVVVPNAQSNTGSYWFFEDFTHKTLFTSGSLLYVLRSAGFNKINFIDRIGTEGFGFLIRSIRKLFFPIYYYNKLFWNRITDSKYHLSSPKIFTWELKVVAEK